MVTAPRLVEQGCIQVLAHIPNSVVYAVDTDATPGRAKDTSTVLKGWAVWYNGKEPVGPVKPPDQADATVRREAAIYEALGKRDRILNYIGLEVAVLESAGPIPKAWALHLERAPGSSLREYLYDHPTNPPSQRIRLELASQFAEGLTHVHSRGIVWSDVSTRNALMLDGWCLKLRDFGTSSRYEDYDHEWWGAESRYTAPGPQAYIQKRKDIQVDTIHREILALGSAIYEIVEWKVPLEEIHQMLIADKWPELSSNNPAGDIIRQCWAYKYESAQQVVRDLRRLLEASKPTPSGLVNREGSLRPSEVCIEKRVNAREENRNTGRDSWSQR